VTGVVGGDVAVGDEVTLTINLKEFKGDVFDDAGTLKFSINVPGADLAADGDKTIDASVTTSTDSINGEVTATDTETYSLDQLPTLTMGSSLEVDEGYLLVGNDYDPAVEPDPTQDSGSFAFTTGDQPITLTIGEDDGSGYGDGKSGVQYASISDVIAGEGNQIITEHGQLTIGTLQNDGSGNYTLNYNYQLTSAEDHDLDDGFDKIAVRLVDNDGDGADDPTTPDPAINGLEFIVVDITDDVPVPFDPDSTIVTDDSNVPSSAIGLNFANAAGADGPGPVTFKNITEGGEATDVHGNKLSIGSSQLYTYTNTAGTTLWVATADPDGQGPYTIAFEAVIDGDTYTVISTNGVISNGSDLSTADLSTVGGGNENPKTMINPFGGQSSLDILVTGAGGSGSNNDNTVNSNNGQLAVGTGQDVDFDDTDSVGDVLRMEFGSLEDGDTEMLDENRMTVNRFLLPIESVTNATVEIYLAYNHPDTGIETEISDFKIFNATGEIELTYPGDLQNLDADTTVLIVSQENFDTIKISHGTDNGEGTFKVGQFALMEFVEGDPIHVAYDIEGLDGDGDSIGSSIDFTIKSETDNVVEASFADDNLAGTADNDIFVWELSDVGTTADPSNDSVAEFAVDGNDVLDVRDLLQLEDSGLPNEIGNLLEYLHVEESGGSTLISVSSTGGFTGGLFDVDQVDQTITLTDVDLVTAQGDLESIIQNMLDAGKLVTD
jgi:hypothetical protein